MITSTANTRIKDLITLHKRSRRDAEGLFLIEGVSEIQIAAGSAVDFTAVYYCPDLASAQTEKMVAALSCECIHVSRRVFEKIAYRGGTGGIVAVARQRSSKLADICLSDTPLILVAEGIEKPGNIGAMLRTAEAAGADAVIICGCATDLYNPNVIRSSLGALFGVAAVACTPDEAIGFLQAKGVPFVAAVPGADTVYTQADLSGPAALVVGSEATGLSSRWRDACRVQVHIPMCGKVNSLNASVSAALLLYEAVRQRRRS